MGVIGIMAMYCIQNWKLCYIARHHLPLKSHCFGLQKTQCISGLMDRTVIDITQLGCLPLARHQLHVCMPHQVQTWLCIADSLFITSIAKLLHS